MCLMFADDKSLVCAGFDKQNHLFTADGDGWYPLIFHNPHLILFPRKYNKEYTKPENKIESNEEENQNSDKNLVQGTNNTVIKKKRYKIQEVIKPNQVILVQVLKDERGLKGAALTTFISIAGKYTVLMPNTPKGGGISRKIFNPIDRKKIRQILNLIEIPKEMGLIVRTAGSNKTKNDIEGDLKNSISAWGRN